MPHTNATWWPFLECGDSGSSITRLNIIIDLRAQIGHHCFLGQFIKFCGFFLVFDGLFDILDRIWCVVRFLTYEYGHDCVVWLVVHTYLYLYEYE